jgi:hypothetical protein
VAGSEPDRDADNHFTGQGKCKIHTSRSHNECGNSEGKSGCDHQGNCEKKAVAWKQDKTWIWDNEWESHHVLCISCVNKYQVLKAYSSDHRTNIDAIYRKTPWCINQSPNLIALPMRFFYEHYVDGRSMNLPCHDWDHNITGGYTDEVTKRIHNDIWQKIKQTIDEKEQCAAAEEVVLKELKGLSKEFKDKLTARGERPVGAKKGTLAAWSECETKADTDRADKWWFSFSMAEDSVAEVRHPMTFGKPKWTSAEERLALRQKYHEAREK